MIMIFLQGTKLPTVEALASEYKVSKSTIVKAIEYLVAKKLYISFREVGFLLEEEIVLVT